MGKKKKEAVGKSIVKERNRGLRNPTAKDSWLHTSELNDGYDWGRLNLQSVTEQSALNEFLTTAELAGTEFTAEKLNVTVVAPGRNDGLLSTEEKQTVTQVQEEHREFLRIPRRPKWDETTTAEKLASSERDSFLEWRRQISVLQDKEHIILTPFERNLDFWRQLWRVIERSDVVVQIVDARNPLLFRCEDLEKYVLEVDPKKSNLLLINKADLLTPVQREIWGEYFKEQGVPVAFWSALAENERLEKEQEAVEEMSLNTKTEQPYEEKFDNELVTEQEGDIPRSRFAGLSIEPDIHDDENLSGGEKQDLEQDDTHREEIHKDFEDSLKPSSFTEDKGCTETISDVSLSTHESHTEPRKHENIENSDVSKLKEKEEAKNDCSGHSDTRGCIEGSQSRVYDSVSKNLTSEETCNSDEEVTSRDIDLNYTGKLVTKDELLSLCQALGGRSADQVTTVGMVGYPNVGKSSTINTIFQDKKVSISATPGKTKHFQTLFVNDKVCLCDCPGLVFPSFVSTKAEMVLNGVLPIDQMRDHVPPVSLLCQHIPREVLELVYGVNIAPPGEGEDPNRAPYAEELLSAYGYMRGYMTSHGAPDCPRSSRYVLKDYVKGKLLYCTPPPGVDPELFQEHRFTSAAYVDMESKGKNKTKEGGAGAKKKTQTSTVDKDFFQQEQVRVFTKGVTGTEKHQMMAGRALPPGAAEAAQALGPGESLMYKPWKKHFNKNKKEKTRRLVKN